MDRDQFQFVGPVVSFYYQENWDNPNMLRRFMECLCVRRAAKRNNRTAFDFIWARELSRTAPRANSMRLHWLDRNNFVVLIVM